MRSYGHIDQLSNAVMVQIMAQCQEENVLTEFMEHYGTELIEMLFKELTREEDLEISRLDGYDAGVKDGEKSGLIVNFTVSPAGANLVANGNAARVTFSAAGEYTVKAAYAGKTATVTVKVVNNVA